jgi:CubicO group peptidase (beta-lactamase class C family)
MQRIVQFGAMLVLCASQFACTPAPSAPPAPPTKEMAAVAGHYYLQGVTEVGSELLLRKDGQYQWMLSYGAVDQGSEGTWHLKDKQLVLSSSSSSSPFKTLTLMLADGKLAMNDPVTGMKGVYVRNP